MKTHSKTLDTFAFSIAALFMFFLVAATGAGVGYLILVALAILLHNPAIALGAFLVVLIVWAFNRVLRILDLKGGIYE